jgi:hypothetical protein
MKDEGEDNLFKHLKPILQRHLDYIEEMHAVLEMSIQGISSLKMLLPGIAKAYERGDLERDISDERLSEISMNMAARTDLASAEIERGFPILYSHATVALWSAVEAFSADLAVGLLKYDAKLFTHKNLSKVHVPLASFQRMSEEERLSFLVGELRKSLSGADRGVGQYNEMFNQLGLKGALHKNIRDPMIELCQVRNIIVHRGGIVDVQLTDLCPWLEVQRGERLIVLKPRYEAYWMATHRYWLELANRVRGCADMEPIPDPVEQ